MMSKQFRIVLGLGLDDDTERILREVARYASTFDASLEILHVAPPDPDMVGYLKGLENDVDTQEDIIRKSKGEQYRFEHERLQRISRKLKAAGVRVETALSIQGNVPEKLLKHARETRADLLMIGHTHHGALYRAVYGDTAAAIVKSPPCPILIVPT